MNIEYGLCESSAARWIPPPGGHREVGLAAEHVTDLARLVDDLIHRDERERDHAPVDDRAKAAARGAEADAGEGRLGDRREAHAAVAELVLEGRGAGGRERDHPLVALHLFDHRLFERLHDRDLSHWRAPHSANMSTRRSLGSGYGLFSANSTAAARSRFARSRIACTSPAAASPRPIRTSSKRAIGSRSRPRHWAKRSADRRSGWGASRMAWKSQRNVLQWSRVGPSPRRARSTACRAASRTASTSLPSTETPGIP